ncbi:hypothetical protein SAMN05216565_101507 [Litchfieldia salsa]|uniref:Uncharacterized protein n=1 Tax=Litchfieldia salsa TaxID=930152 RepID=A0A1H0PYJ2_9BACI|nr:hypothetical protein SAMN05216565_101507 [Litchfieldia salsa]
MYSLRTFLGEVVSDRIGGKVVEKSLRRGIRDQSGGRSSREVLDARCQRPLEWEKKFEKSLRRGVRDQSGGRSCREVLDAECQWQDYQLSNDRKSNTPIKLDQGKNERTTTLLYF